MKNCMEAIGSDGRKMVKSCEPFSKWVMADSCQNCGSPIPAHLEAEYCSRCADMEYGLTGGGK